MSVDAEWQAAYSRLLIHHRLVPQDRLQHLARLCAERGEGLRDHLLRTGVVRPQDDAQLIATLQAGARLSTTGHGSRSDRPQSSLPTRLPNPGETFAGYAIQSEIARGGAGAVYVATAHDGTRVALKVLLHDVTKGARRERFLREVEIGTALRHPGIVQVLDHGEADGRPYLVMELLEDATPLDRYVDLNAPPALERARLVMEVAQAVHAAHQAGIIHRDLKPDNVLITQEGQVKVVDFGIAHQEDRDRLTQSGAVMGTLHYMPPEQVRGQSAHVDARADVYSLGVMLYRLISGELPYDGDTSVQVMSAIMDQPVPDLRASVPDVPPGLPEVVRVAMAKLPEHRYDSASEFAQDLSAVSSGSDTAAFSRLHHIPQPKRGRWVTLGVLVLLLALGAGFAAVWLTRGVDPKELKRQAGPIYDDAWHLLSVSEARLSSDSESVEELLGRMRALDERARGPDARMALDRPRRRLRALEGLLALSQGNREAARACATPTDNPNPAEGALLGALEAIHPEGDAELAARLLSQALARGIKRADLHLWRAMAWSRGGFSDNQAELALGGLDILRTVSGGSLDYEESCLYARALVAVQRADDAHALLAGLEKPASPSLRWEVALAGVELYLETNPVDAVEFMDDLPPQEPTDPRRLVLAKKIERVALGLMRDLGYTPVTKAQEQQLAAWAQLSRRLDPAAPSPELVSALLAEATGIKVDAGLPELGLTLTRLFPDDPEVQVQVARLVARNRQDTEITSRFMPALRRGIKLVPGDRNRAILRSLLLSVLRDRVVTKVAHQGEYAEAVQLAESVLAVTDDRVERGEILWRRADLHLLQENYAAALLDATAAVDLNDKDVRCLEVKADALLKLGRYEQSLPVALRLGKLAKDGGTLNSSLRILWALAREGQDPARIYEALDPVVAVHGNNSRWWIRLAWLQLKSSRHETALASLRKATALIPKTGPLAELGPRLQELVTAVSEQRDDAQAKADALVESLETPPKKAASPKSG